jgi:iron only hydrogenase large subunit-like protein
LTPENASLPFDERSTSGLLCGVSGGFSEAVARTTYKLLCGSEYAQTEISSLRGSEGRKEARISFPTGGNLNVFVTGGLRNARILLEDLRNGRIDADFIEINACPNGCISGGGQPVHIYADSIKRQMKALYAIDRTENIRYSHKNRLIAKLYDEFLGAPMSNKSSELLYMTKDI